MRTGLSSASEFGAGSERPEPRREAVVLLHLETVVLHEVGRFLDVADALETVFPRFVSHQRRQLPAMGADGGGNFLHEGDAIAPGSCVPCRIRGACRRDGFTHLVAAGALKCSQQDPCVNRTAIVEFGRRPNVASTDEERIAPAERRSDSGDRRVNLPMEILQLVAAQAAVALENARLYGKLRSATAELQRSNDTLETQVAERTQELQRTLAELWSEMDLYSRDAQEACRKWDVPYPIALEQGVRNHLRRCCRRGGQEILQQDEQDWQDKEADSDRATLLTVWSAILILT